MGFKIVKKNAGLPRNGPMDVSISKHGFSFGHGLTPVFEKHECVEVYLDIEDKKIGFSPTNNKITGFRINKISRSWTLSTTGVVKRIPFGRYVGRVEDGMVVIDVPEIATK